MQGHETTQIKLLKKQGRRPAGSEYSVPYRVASTLKDKGIAIIIEAKPEKAPGKKGLDKLKTQTEKTEDDENGADIQPKTATDMDSGK